MTHYLRGSAELILQPEPGEHLARETMEACLAHDDPDRFSAASLKSFSQNINGTWTQAGYLSGKAKKYQEQPKVSYVNVAYALFVSCLQAGCERYFRYLSDGRVVPSSALDTHDISKAKYTIELLNLNSPFLNNRRRKWWDELDELVQEHLDNDMDLSQLASVDLVPTRNKLSPFFSLTRQFFANQAETVLREQAPELL